MPYALQGLECQVSTSVNSEPCPTSHGLAWAAWGAGGSAAPQPPVDGVGAVILGLGRIVALDHRAPTSYQIHGRIR
jgi:hypothetical protein